MIGGRSLCHQILGTHVAPSFSTKVLNVLHAPLSFIDHYWTQLRLSSSLRLALTRPYRLLYHDEGLDLVPFALCDLTHFQSAEVMNAALH